MNHFFFSLFLKEKNTKTPLNWEFSTFFLENPSVFLLQSAATEQGVAEKNDFFCLL